MLPLAGTLLPAGRGDVWYVACVLDDDGVAAVVRHVLAGHELLGPHADDVGVEVTRRVSPDGTLTSFVLHHGERPLDTTAQVTGTDALTGRSVVAGEPLHLEPAQVLVLQPTPEES